MKVLEGRLRCSCGRLRTPIIHDYNDVTGVPVWECTSCYGSKLHLDVVKGYVTQSSKLSRFRNGKHVVRDYEESVHRMLEEVRQ